LKVRSDGWFHACRSLRARGTNLQGPPLREPAAEYYLCVPLQLVDHPLAHDALAELRDADTTVTAFRRAAARISTVLAVEALRRVPTSPSSVRTPLGPAPARRVQDDVVLVPVLRAGLGMLEPVLQLVPSARVGHVGLQRDETTAVASQYYSRLPPHIDESYVLLLDPMLATGGSAAAALALIKSAGARAIALVSIVAAPEGIALLDSAHPDVIVYTPVVDRELNAHKFIVPGLGDFGDRLYGT
jgi:uracil phosphoribosyltransferase